MSSSTTRHRSHRQPTGIRSSLDTLPAEITQMIAVAAGPDGRSNMLEALECGFDRGPFSALPVTSPVYDSFKKTQDDHVYAFVTASGTISTDASMMAAATHFLTERLMPTWHTQPSSRDRQRDKGISCDLEPHCPDICFQTEGKRRRRKTVVVLSSASAHMEGGTLCCDQAPGYGYPEQLTHAQLTLRDVGTRSLVIDYRNTLWDRSELLPWKRHPLLSCELRHLIKSENTLQLMTDFDGWLLFRTTSSEPHPLEDSSSNSNHVPLVLASTEERAQRESRHPTAPEAPSSSSRKARRTHYIGYSRNPYRRRQFLEEHRQWQMQPLARLASESIWCEYVFGHREQSLDALARIRWVDVDMFRRASSSPLPAIEQVSYATVEKTARNLVRTHLQNYQVTEYLHEPVLSQLVDDHLDFVSQKEFDDTVCGELLDRYNYGTIDYM